MSGRRTLAHPIHMARTAYPTIQFHRIHLPALSSFGSGFKVRNFAPRRSDHPTDSVGILSPGFTAQPGVLYISGLPVEKNLFAGLQRKLKTIVEAFSVIHGRAGKVEVCQSSSCRVDLPDGCIDYVFTDPPFGGNIPYAEINFINEAWLGDYTDRSDEIIVRNSQKKTIAQYQNLLTTALSEVRRILSWKGRRRLYFTPHRQMSGTRYRPPIQMPG